MASIADELYLFGGRPGGNSVNDLWKISTTSDDVQWESISSDDSDVPKCRRGATMVALSQQLLVFGGADPDALNDLWAYDPTSNKWALIPQSTGFDPPTERQDAAAVAVRTSLVVVLVVRRAGRC